MTNRNDILNELKELGSNLSVTPFENIYTVPAGYFEGFASQMLARVKAIDAIDARDELNYLSPFLKNLSKENPYKAPIGYFDGLEERMMNVVRGSSDYQTTDEELESLSPLLQGLKKENPYTVPQGYFENLSVPVIAQTETRVVSITSRKWYRYAAAAVVIGMIAIVGIKMINTERIGGPIGNSHAWVEKNVKKVSTDKINEFIELASKEKNESVAINKSDDMKDLIKDIPENEIQNFLNETQVLNDETDEILMN